MRLLISRAASVLVAWGGVAAILFGPTLADATIVYDNTSGSFSSIDTGEGPVEAGDLITLAGTERVVTEFVFWYTTFNADSTMNDDGDETARVRFYEQGVSGAPGAVIYDSGTFALPVTGGHQFITVSVPSVLVPDTFFFGVYIDGVKEVVVRTFDPIAVGASDTSWWIHDLSGWSQAPPGFDSLAARVTAVPEPAGVFILATGLIAQRAWPRRHAARGPSGSVRLRGR
jgi:hypothetical protein